MSEVCLVNTNSPISAQGYLYHLMFVDPCIIVQFIKKNPTRCNNVSDFYYSIFIWSSTCFGRHTAYHQEPKTALAASGWWKTRGCQCSFRLLMMGRVSPETCWASYKYGIIKFWYIVASCWIFLYEVFIPLTLTLESTSFYRHKVLCSFLLSQKTAVSHKQH